MRRMMRKMMMVLKSSHSDQKNSMKKNRIHSTRMMKKMTNQLKMKKPSRKISKYYKNCLILKARLLKI